MGQNQSTASHKEESLPPKPRKPQFKLLWNEEGAEDDNLEVGWSDDEYDNWLKTASGTDDEELDSGEDKNTAKTNQDQQPKSVPQKSERRRHDNTENPREQRTSRLLIVRQRRREREQSIMNRESSTLNSDELSTVNSELSTVNRQVITVTLEPSIDSARRSVLTWEMLERVADLDTYSSQEKDMLTLYIPPGMRVEVLNFLQDERERHEEAGKGKELLLVTYAIEALEQHGRHLPANGLVIMCRQTEQKELDAPNSDTSIDQNKAAMIQTYDWSKVANHQDNPWCVQFEPCRPWNKLIFKINSNFCTDFLLQLSEPIAARYAFIVLDTFDVLFGVVSEEGYEVLDEYENEVKMGSDGAFGKSDNPRQAFRRELVRNTFDKALEYFHKKYGKRAIAGVILAGSKDVKVELEERKHILHPHVFVKALKVVEVRQAGEWGFNEAMVKAADVLPQVRILHEIKVFQEYFHEIPHKTCYGPDLVLNALDKGMVKTLLVWDYLGTVRCQYYNEEVNHEHVLLVQADGYQDGTMPHTISTEGLVFKLQKTETLLHWLVDNYRSFGVTMEIMSEATSQRTRFIQEHGGIGAILICRNRALEDLL